MDTRAFGWGALFAEQREMAAWTFLFGKGFPGVQFFGFAKVAGDKKTKAGGLPMGKNGRRFGVSKATSKVFSRLAPKHKRKPATMTNGPDKKLEPTLADSCPPPPPRDAPGNGGPDHGDRGTNKREA